MHMTLNSAADVEWPVFGACRPLRAGAGPGNPGPRPTDPTDPVNVWNAASGKPLPRPGRGPPHPPWAPPIAPVAFLPAPIPRALIAANPTADGTAILCSSSPLPWLPRGLSSTTSSPERAPSRATMPPKDDVAMSSDGSDSESEGEMPEVRRETVPALFPAIAVGGAAPVPPLTSFRDRQSRFIESRAPSPALEGSAARKRPSPRCFAPPLPGPARRSYVIGRRAPVSRGSPLVANEASPRATVAPCIGARGKRRSRVPPAPPGASRAAPPTPASPPATPRSPRRRT